MPAPADTPLAEAYGDRLELVARTAAVAASRTWDPEGLWINAAGAAIRGGQAVGIALAREHARLVLERAGTGTELPAEARADALGKLSSGMVLERALAAAAVAIEAAAPADRPQVARNAIARIAHSATYDASRAELHALIEAGPFTGWRWLSRGTCAACLSRDDGGDKPDGSAMRVHPGCRCVAEPLARDPLEARLPTADPDELRFGQDPPAGAESYVDELELEEREAVLDYTTGGYRELNGRLWRDLELSPEQAALARRLDSTIAKAGDLPEPAVVWHGTKVGPTLDSLGAEGVGLSREAREELLERRLADWAEETYAVGSEITFPGFTSTSLRSDAALDASLSTSSPGIVFEIVATRGAYVQPVTRFDDEWEILLARGSRFRVVNVIRRATFERDSGATPARTVVQVIQI